MLPTREDIWGLVINEAMACGLPVISTDMCLGAIELLDTECIVPVDDVSSLKEKIEKFMANEVLREEQGNRNLTYIQQYTYENVIQSHIDSISIII